MRIPSLLAPIFLSLLLISPQAIAATVVPIRFSAGMIRVQVMAEGQAEPLTFLLDSGAGASVIDLAAARRLGLKLGRSESVQGVHTRTTAYRVNRVVARAGSVPIPSSMLALDLTSIGGAVGCRVDGLLGVDFFRGRAVEINYAAGTLRLLAASEVAAAGAEVLPLVRRNGTLCVRLGIGDRSGECVRVDTGCSAALEWVTATTPSNGRVPTSIGFTNPGRRSSSVDLQLGAIRLAGVSVGLHDRPIFPGEDGLLGNGVLSRFTVTIDARKGRLILGPR